jgi:ribosomal protein S18 acetylase RimI-like enzyme
VIELSTLQTIPIETLTATFNLAFGEYEVPLDMSPARLGEMLRRRGVRLDLSVGVFEGPDLVGFTFNGLGRYRGEVCGYDSGTGVIPSMRGRGFTTQMLDRTKELLRTAGATSYVLEVLQSNETAASIYRRSGFVTTRELICYRADHEVGGGESIVEESREFDETVFASMWDSEPSWQNTTESIHRAAEARTVLVVRDGGDPVGYAILFPASGDIAQLAVAGAARRRGIGTALLAGCIVRSAVTPRILNIDSADAVTNAFYAARTSELVRQFEMRCAL